MISDVADQFQEAAHVRPVLYSAHVTSLHPLHGKNDKVQGTKMLCTVLYCTVLYCTLSGGLKERVWGKRHGPEHWPEACSKKVETIDRKYRRPRPTHAYSKVKKESKK